MTDAQKLEALIRRANWKTLGDPNEIDFRNDSPLILTTWDGYDIGPGCAVIINHHVWSWQQIIFNHDFARALFGTKKTSDVAYKQWKQFEKKHLKGIPSEQHYKIQENFKWPFEEGLWESEYDDAVFAGEVWQYHLQMAVISDNPIDYMYNVVFGGEK